MRDVVIIGGGLSGLAAAYELEQQQITYTLIEVKPRLGGGIYSAHQGGFALDSGPMTHAITDLTAFQGFLAGLSLAEDFIIRPTPPANADDDDPPPSHGLFRNGTGALIDALAGRITAPIMHRMAVSTVGRMMDSDGRSATRSAGSGADRFAICMENGMLLDAKALIVAAPARHAERMFHTLTPEISYRLLNYRYDTITRLSFGYLVEDDLPTTPPEDYPLTEIRSTRQPGRVPPGGLLLQAGLRVAEHDLPDDPIGQTAALMDWPLNPTTDHIATWSESDPVMWLDPSHAHNMDAIFHLLPPGVGLAGGDYIAAAHPPRLDERVGQGVAAARRVINWLKND